MTADGLKAIDHLVEQGINPHELIERLILEQASELDSTESVEGDP